MSSGDDAFPVTSSDTLPTIAHRAPRGSAGAVRTDGSVDVGDLLFCISRRSDPWSRIVGDRRATSFAGLYRQGRGAASGRAAPVACTRSRWRTKGIPLPALLRQLGHATSGSPRSVQGSTPQRSSTPSATADPPISRRRPHAPVAGPKSRLVIGASRTRRSPPTSRSHRPVAAGPTHLRGSVPVNASAGAAAALQLKQARHPVAGGPGRLAHA